MSSTLIYHPTTIYSLDFAIVAQVLRHIFSSEFCFPFLLEYPYTFISSPALTFRARNLVSIVTPLLKLLMFLFLGYISSSSTLLWYLVNAPNVFISTPYATIRACNLAIHVKFCGLVYLVMRFLSISWLPKWLLRFLRELSLVFVKSKDFAAIVRKLWEAEQPLAKSKVMGGADGMPLEVQSSATSPATHDDTFSEGHGSLHDGKAGFGTHGHGEDRSQPEIRQQQRGNTTSAPSGTRRTSIYSRLRHYGGMFCQLASESANPAHSMREHRAGRMGQSY